MTGVTKRDWAKTLIKTAAFLLIGALLFHLCNTLFLEKSSYRKYQAWKENEDVNVLILGNSHADNGLRAQAMSEALTAETGREVTVFNYAVFGMRMEQMYFFTKEILKTHTPDVIVLETFAFCPLADEHRDVLAHRAFDVLPLNRNKVEAVNYCVLENRAAFCIPFISYHTRWKELNKEDLDLLLGNVQWPMYGSNGIAQTDSVADPGDGWFDQTPPQEEQTPTETELECLENLLELLAEKDIPLVFVSLPYRQQMGMDSIQQIKVNNYLRNHYVNGGSVQMLDMNLMWDELDFGYHDLYDEGHANAAGADKFTAALLDYLTANCDLRGPAA